MRLIERKVSNQSFIPRLHSSYSVSPESAKIFKTSVTPNPYLFIFVFFYTKKFVAKLARLKIIQT